MVALVFIVRLPALLQSSTGSDEGLFVLIARDWLNGHLPYTTVWEAKPPLFFAILATAMALLGKTMFAIRIANDLAIAATAAALYAIGASLRRDGATIGFAAACFYAAMTLSDSGQSAVAESFYSPFIALAFAVVVQRTWPPRAFLWRSFGLGATLAAAVLVKESAAFEAGYAAVVVVVTTGLASALPLIAGMAAMLAATFAPYVVTAHAGLFWDANVASVTRRAPVAVPDVAPWYDVLRAQLLAFFPATLLAFAVPIARRRTGTERADVELRGLVAIVTGWGVASLATVFSIREFLGNHFIGAMAPASVLAAIVTVALARRIRSDAFVPIAIGIALVAHAGYQFVLAAPIVLDRLRSGDPTYGDPTAELAAYLNAHKRANQALYVADDRTVLYVLTRASSPTRYAYPAHLLDRYQELIAGVDGTAEIGRILRTEPAYIVRDRANVPNEDPRGAALLNAALRAGYRAVFSVGTHTIYARDDAA